MMSIQNIKAQSLSGTTWNVTEPAISAKPYYVYDSPKSPYFPPGVVAVSSNISQYFICSILCSEE